MFVRIFEEKLSRTIPKSPLPIFCKITLNSDISIKSSIGPETISGGTIKHVLVVNEQHRKSGKSLFSVRGIIIRRC